MDLLAYIKFCAVKVEEAGDKGDRAEAIRILRLISHVCLEKADELARPTTPQEQK